MSTHSRYLSIITAFFVTCLLVSNIIAVKLLQIGPFTIPAGTIIFPLSYLFGDVLTEVYGYATTRRVIWLGFVCNLLAVIAIWVAGLLPAAPFWTQQAAYNTILGFTPRLLGASFISYLIGEFINSFVLARLKILTKGKYLWTRTIGSTIVGQGVDTAVFITLAFIGIIPSGALLLSILVQWLFKCVYEIIATPLTYAVVNALKRGEGLDVYDTHTNFTPFSLRMETGSEQTLEEPAR